MEFRILGPLEVHVEGRALALGGVKPRALLAVLLLNANEPVSAERLALALWGEDAPAGAVKTVQVHVSRLRKALGEIAPLETTAAGYRLAVGPEALDAARFEALAAEGRALLRDGDPAAAGERLRGALALWRGPPLGDLASLPFAAPEIARLEEQRLAVLEARVQADLATGRHAELVGELQRLTGEHPWRERLHAQRMLALYRSGRQADALAAYREARARLSEELGLEPGEELRGLEQRMLAHDPALDAPEPPAREATAPAPPAPAGARRVVSVLHAAPATLDERDPEVLHDRLDRVWDTCAAAIERHGGAVEAGGGDAVVGLFGLERAQEDDALRALRAAVEMRAGAELRIGVDAGEVFSGGASRRRARATGEAVGVAAALAEAALPSEILVGDGARRLAAAAVRVEPLEPLPGLEPKAWRLLELSGEEGAARPVSASPFVGRERELERLRAIVDEAARERACRLVTITGGPGLGKSRLARELVAALGSAAGAVTARCAPYGQGSSFDALAELVRALAGEDLAAALGGDEAAAAKLRAATGLGSEPARPEEIAWALRRLLERAAGERPLVVVVEDVHWAAPSLLDTLEYVAAFSTGAPVLLLCLARPELLETRPSWAARQAHRAELALDPLPAAAVAELVGAVAPEAEAARIAEAAEGNPLFAEQLAAVGGAGEVPLSLQAVLAARIDRLDPGERTVHARAAVEGRSFHAGALAELLPPEERRSIPAHLLALVRRRLVAAEPTELEGEDGFRFTHALIRDAAYDGLPKRLRAELHERVARWLEPRARPPHEVVGHHLEQACRLGAELGLPGPAADAARHLDAAAGAALLRGDPRAAAGLLERAAALLGLADEQRTALLPRLGAALFEAGRLADAGEILAEATTAADPAVAARARIERQLLRIQTDPATDPEESRAVADEALRVLDGDGAGAGRAWFLRAWVDWTEGRTAAADDAWRRAAEHAAAAHDERERYEVLCWRASAAAFGPEPANTAIARCEAIRDEVRASPVAVAATLHPLATLHAMRGEAGEARRLIREGNAILDALGRMQSAVSHHEAMVELLAGDPAGAEARLRRGFDALREMGERGLLATTAAMLAQAVLAQGRDEEAGELAAVAATAAPREDLATQAIWRGVSARVLARAGADGEAAALAHEAVLLVARTDLLTHHADALLDLAEVERLGGRPAEAEGAARRALALYEAKGNAVSAGRARSWLAGGPDGPTTEVDGGAALAVRQAGDVPGRQGDGLGIDRAPRG